MKVEEVLLGRVLPEQSRRDGTHQAPFGSRSNGSQKGWHNARRGVRR